MTAPAATAERSPTLAARMKRNVDAIVRDDAKVEANAALRNQLWQEAVAAGWAATDIAALYGVEAQTVRWNLKQMAGGVNPKPRGTRQRGLKAGGRR